MLLRAADVQYGVCAASCSGLQAKSNHKPLTSKVGGIRPFMTVAL